MKTKQLVLVIAKLTETIESAQIFYPILVIRHKVRRLKVTGR